MVLLLLQFWLGLYQKLLRVLSSMEFIRLEFLKVLLWLYRRLLRLSMSSLLRQISKMMTSLFNVLRLLYLLKQFLRMLLSLPLLLSKQSSLFVTSRLPQMSILTILKFFRNSEEPWTTSSYSKELFLLPKDQFLLLEPQLKSLIQKSLFFNFVFLHPRLTWRTMLLFLTMPKSIRFLKKKDNTL